jgi:hypothetical protein
MGYDGGTKSEPKGRLVLIPDSWEAPGYCSPWLLSHDVYLESVIDDL